MSPIGLSPVIISARLDGDLDDPSIGFGETKNFPVFRHEYAMPYLLDEITIGPIDTTIDWRIYHGGIALCGDWVSPFAMARRISPEEQLVANNANANPGLGVAGQGLLSMLQWKLDRPLLVMPNEQITVRLRRPVIVPGNADNPNAYGLVERLTPLCTLKGMSLDSSYRAPPKKVVPFTTGYRQQFRVGDSAPQVETFQTGDGDITNPNVEDLKLARFGIFTALDVYPNFGLVQLTKGVPYAVPTGVTISDSEGGYIIKDPADVLMLTNGGTRIWDVKGSLRSHQFWTVQGSIDFSPYAAFNALNNVPESYFSLMMALTGYRLIDNTQPLKLTGNFYQRSEP